MFWKLNKMLRSEKGTFVQGTANAYFNINRLSQRKCSKLELLSNENKKSSVFSGYSPKIKV